MRQFPKSEVTPSPSVEDLVADVTQQLAGAAERATQEHGNQLIADIFASVFQQPRTGKERRAHKRAERERQRLIAGFSKRLLGGIERCTRLRVKELLAEKRAERRKERAAASASAAARATNEGAGLSKPRRRRKPVRPVPPPLDPEQIKRDAEIARLRALLRPVAQPAPVPIAPPPVVVVREPVRPSTPGDVLRALEKEIQNAVPTLGTLGPERCTAQIAVWSGQVREVRDRLPPDVATTMRPAFRIFLEHLAQLQVAMEAQVVDALEPTFNAPDWEVYIEANRARVEQRPPRLPDEKLQIFHRTMLRALILPHRRNASQEAIKILEAASRALPPTDPQLQSALRRFASLWKTRAAAAPIEAGQSTTPPAPSIPGTAVTPPAVEPPSPPSPPSTPASPDSEFDSPWIK
jgi:hypothetical protein